MRLCRLITQITRSFNKLPKARFINRLMEQPKKHPIASREASPYGDLPMIQSEDNHPLNLTPLSAISEALVGKKILVRARLQSSTVKGNMAFLVLRQEISTVQATVFKSDKITKELLGFVG